MKNIVIIALFGFLLWNCSSEDKKKGEIKARIVEIEDSLSRIDGNSVSEQILMNELNIRLLDQLITFYRKYPDDELTPQYLGKIHLKYSGMQMYLEAAKFGDTLLEKYPDYEDRAIILESQASNYNYFLEPRDKKKVKKYLTLLLKENPDLPAEKKKEIQIVLDNIDLDWEELVKKQEE